MDTLQICKLIVANTEQAQQNTAQQGMENCWMSMGYDYDLVNAAKKYIQLNEQLEAGNNQFQYRQV